MATCNTRACTPRHPAAAPLPTARRSRRHQPNSQATPADLILRAPVAFTEDARSPRWARRACNGSALPARNRGERPGRLLTDTSLSWLGCKMSPGSGIFQPRLGVLSLQGDPPVADTELSADAEFLTHAADFPPPYISSASAVVAFGSFHRGSLSLPLARAHFSYFLPIISHPSPGGFAAGSCNAFLNAHVVTLG